MRSGLTASLRTEGTHGAPPLKDLSHLQAPRWDMGQCCSWSEPLPGNRVRRKRDKVGLGSTSTGSSAL